MTPGAPARKGKIARLPLRIREEVCERLLDGQPGSVILPWLNALPDTKAILKAHFDGIAVSDENLSQWRDGGYQDWLKDHQKVESVRQIGELSFRMARASGGNLSEGLLAVAAGKIQTALEDFFDGLRDISSTDEGNDKDQAISRLVSALTSIRGMELETQKTRLRERQADQKDKQIALDEKRFMRETCELFIKFAEDAEAKRIATSSDLSNDNKLEALGRHLFKDAW